jgi:hypothetical protein
MRPTIQRLTTSLASLGLAALVACAAAGPAAAAEPVNGYTVTAYGSVGCDAATSTMSVSAFAMTWQGEGALLGWQPTEYDAGQWMRYDVLVREVGQTDWTTIYTWSDWSFVTTMTINGDMAINTPAELGTSVVQGVAGHAYEVLVQVDFWTGVDNVYDTETTYTQTLSTSPYSTYYLNPSACWF